MWRIFFFALNVLRKKEVMSSKPVIHLAGTMEKAFDHGIEWREKITPVLERLGYAVANPCITETTVVPPQEFLSAKKNDFNLYKQMAAAIVDFYLNLIEGCIAVFVRIDEPTLQGAGTFGEITFCKWKNIPVYAWIDLPEGKYGVPGWAMGCVTTYAESYKEALALVPEVSI